jgi:hypothetical protein
MSMGGSRSSVAGSAPSEPSLPPGYKPLKEIHEEEVSPGSLVNVIGVVKDCQLPIPTKGTGEC